MCGVVGLVGTPDASTEAFLGLTTLQHRGQDAAGILTYDADGFHRTKNLGLVETVFTRQNMASLTGNIAIGHARYGTVGKGDVVDVQPFLLSYPFGLGMVHNGNIVNFKELANYLKVKYRRHLLTHSDSEVVLNLFAAELGRRVGDNVQDSIEFDQICETVNEIYAKVKGSYSIVTLVAGHGLVAFRDPNGIRPLVWGKRKGDLPSGEAHMFASESVALAFNGYEKVRDIQAGEVIFIDMQGKVHTRVLDKQEHRPCMFEWVYFASPESVMDEVPVYGARIDLGRNLARVLKEQMKARGIEADMVVPVPETSRIAAVAVSEELGIPYREVLIKNRYIKRTFILDSQEKRQKAVNLKLSPVRSEIQGKRVLLIDDSIVRGTTSKKIIDLVRQAGASKVYFLSTCPPIKHPCYYGIDFPVQEELIAYNRDLAEIEKYLGADAVIYQDIPGLVRSVAEAHHSTKNGAHAVGKKFNPCTACLDGEYPTDISSAKNFASQREKDRRHDG